MRKWILALIFAISIAPLASEEKNNSPTHNVVVSVAPYRFFVEKIGGDTINVIVFVPVGASFHDYEPTPKQIFTASNADLWFRIGESFEGRAIQAFQGHKMPVRFVDLRDGVNLILNVGSGHCCCHANGADLHIWLSAREAKIQASAIAKALMETYPEHKALYQERLEGLLRELSDLDTYIGQTLASLKDRVIMVGHPAYAYFARDYNLTQLPIECEGKDPTPRQLTTILEQARAAHICTIFTQRQYGEKAVRLIANELKASVVMLDPYSDDYMQMMRDIADRIKGACPK